MVTIWLAYFTGIIGALVFCDGIASWWAYSGKEGETFWHNHSLRLLRMLYGIALIIIGVLLIWQVKGVLR